MTRMTCAAVLLLGALLSACDANGPDKPVPGDLVVSLDTPGGADRALLLTVTGPAAPTAVVGAAPAYVVHARTQGTTTRVAVFGALADGALLRVTVPDVRQADRYTATLVESADAANVPRAGVAGYALTIARAGS